MDERLVQYLMANRREIHRNPRPVVIDAWEQAYQLGLQDAQQQAGGAGNTPEEKHDNN